MVFTTKLWVFQQFGCASVHLDYFLSSDDRRANQKKKKEHTKQNWC